MYHSDLLDELEAISDKPECWNGEVYIRIGNFQAPLRNVKYIPENDDHEEAIILQAEDYDDDLI